MGINCINTRASEKICQQKSKKSGEGGTFQAGAQRGATPDMNPASSFIISFPPAFGSVRLVDAVCPIGPVIAPCILPQCPPSFVQRPTDDHDPPSCAPRAGVPDSGA